MACRHVSSKIPLRSVYSKLDKNTTITHLMLPFKRKLNKINQGIKGKTMIEEKPLLYGALTFYERRIPVNNVSAGVEAHL